MTKVTEKEFAAQIEEYLRRAEEGESFVVTRADREVASLSPSGALLDASEDVILDSLASRGIVDLPDPNAPSFDRKRKRVSSRGVSASAMVIEDRR